MIAYHLVSQTITYMSIMSIIFETSSKLDKNRNCIINYCTKLYQFGMSDWHEWVLFIRDILLLVNNSMSVGIKLKRMHPFYCFLKVQEHFKNAVHIFLNISTLF